MNFNEFMPIVSGFFVGLLLYFVPKSYRMTAGSLLTVSLGFLAVLTSGEFQISWAFLLIDIPLVALSAVAGFMVAHYLRASVRKSV